MMQVPPSGDLEATGFPDDFAGRHTLVMNLHNWFDLTFANRPNGVGLEWNGTEYTFGEIDARSNRMARALTGRGLVKGDRLCVYLANSIEMIDLYLACVKLGVIFVPVNILYRDREMSHILADAEPKLMIAASDLPALLAEAAAQPGERLPGSGLAGDDVAALVYTSGTTGVSKGAMLTHNNFAVHGSNLIATWKMTAQDRLLLAPPLFHVHALANGLHTWLLTGCRTRLLERFDHQTALSHFEDFKPTVFFGVPAMYVRLLDTPPARAAEIGKRMRLFVCGSAPLPAQILEEVRLLFGHTILERYGMTETLMNISNPYDGERRPGSVGLPLPGVIVKILRADGQEAGPDETGELYLQGPNVFAGYWKREDASKAAFVDGWFKTGDIGSRAADGYYTLSGRKSDLIISGGFNIYPREIEEFLMEQPGVTEAAVVGEPDRVRGEVPVAYVVWGTAADPVALESRCREALASFKIPRRFESIEKLPRNALGKVQKHLLCRAS
jgi:malonyl-CoA/methylmalonyl-CoA synthetase